MDLDFKKASCFGFSHPKSHCWLELAKKAETTGWKSVDAAAFEMDFA